MKIGQRQMLKTQNEKWSRFINRIDTGVSTANGILIMRMYDRIQQQTNYFLRTLRNNESRTTTRNA